MSNQKIFTSGQAKEIGEKIGISWDKFNIEQFRMGMMVELEHGITDPDTDVTNNDPILTGKIALAYLTEYPDYYTRLEKMENEAELYWGGNDDLIKEPENDIGTKKIFSGENDDKQSDSTQTKEPENNIGKDKIFTADNDDREGDGTVIKKPVSDVGTKKLFTAENDEEVLNCEGKPCNFVYDEGEGILNRVEVPIKVLYDDKSK